MLFTIRSFVLTATAAVAFVMWASDFVTLQGERTIYTAQCHDGTWIRRSCSGRLAAGPRYRFRALRAHGEVLFCTAGERKPSGRFTECEIVDGRNWHCAPSADASGSIASEMRHGKAVHDGSGATKPFHAVAKWRWLLLRWGVPAGHSAEN
jgi:hypothetical protein